MSDSNQQTVLMGRNNPTGHKLEELLGTLAEEVKQKSELIKDSKHPLRDMITMNNAKIQVLLLRAQIIQISTYEALDAMEPNRGPENPRL